MNRSLSTEVEAFGMAAQRAFDGLGGVDAARRAEADPGVREGEVLPVLTALGTDDLDPRVDLDSASAAGELCRAAGRVVLPYPVVATLLRQPGGGEPFSVIHRGSRVDHGDLFETWTVAFADGRAHTARRSGARLGSRLGPFVTDVVVDTERGELARDVLFALTLGAWQILGSVERALELAVEHVKGRVQFGQPISAFQAVQFQLADAAVAVDGLRELCRFTLWRVSVCGEEARPDALALRVHALEAARAVLRTTQQLHGAAGVCEEYDISVICRHVQPGLHLPFGVEQTVVELVTAIDEAGFESLFPHGGALQ